jgi:hypothetical protein
MVSDFIIIDFIVATIIVVDLFEEMRFLKVY